MAFTRSRRWPSSASPCWGHSSVPRWDGSSTRCPATSTAAGCRPAFGAARWAHSGRWAVGGIATPAELDVVVIGLVDRITRRMRAAERTGRTVVLRLRFDDFTRITRSHTMPRATASTAPILVAARDLVGATHSLIAERGITLIGFAVSNIDRGGAQQLELPLDGRGPELMDLDAAVDRVRRRYGNAAVTRGVLVGRDPGLEMPQLPD